MTAAIGGGSQVARASSSILPSLEVGGPWAEGGAGGAVARCTATPIATAKPITTRIRMMMTTFIDAAQP